VLELIGSPFHPDTAATGAHPDRTPLRHRPASDQAERLDFCTRVRARGWIQDHCAVLGRRWIGAEAADAAAAFDQVRTGCRPVRGETVTRSTPAPPRQSVRPVAAATAASRLFPIPGSPRNTTPVWSTSPPGRGPQLFSSRPNSRSRPTSGPRTFFRRLGPLPDHLVGAINPSTP